MLDLGWSELLVIGIVALLVVGPKDLPSMFRTVGQYVGKARSMAREFQRSMEDAARQSDIDELRKTAQSVKDVGRVATGGVSGLAQFGLDHTKKYAEKTLTGDDGTAAAPEAPAATPAAPVRTADPAGTAAASAPTPASAPAAENRPAAPADQQGRA
jgi:sec-independent protein translocase protein TatB